MSTVTLASLQKQAQSLPERLVAAVMNGDGAELAQLTAERVALPAQMFAVEVQTLRTEMAALREELITDKAEVKRTGAIASALQDQRRDLEKRHAMALRDAGIAANRLGHTQSELRRCENRIEEIAGAQIALAQGLVARPGWRARP